MQDQIRKIVGDKLAAGEIDLFIGYAAGTLPGKTKPVVLSPADGAGSLVWNEHCDHNLVTYLGRYPGKKVGILVKPCDARVLVTMMQENQVKRDDLWIVGMNCPGVKDEAGEFQSQCPECQVRKPPIADVTLGEEVVPDVIPGESSVEEVWTEFQADMSRCIRCYACRQACPLCYCETCFADQTMPAYLAPGDETVDSAFFQLGRFLHIAGRCGECGGCERVCPADIPLVKMIRKLAGFVEKTYGTKAGMDPDQPCALGTFSTDDDNSSFL